jgi:predicted RNA binding protein YcfA (HicA-like mRNA interferase family)
MVPYGMPRKIRELEADLRRAGFERRPGKGSHRQWAHPTGTTVTVSGKEGSDAQYYQEKDVGKAIEKTKRA